MYLNSTINELISNFMVTYANADHNKATSDNNWKVKDLKYF